MVSKYCTRTEKVVNKIEIIALQVVFQSFLLIFSLPGKMDDSDQSSAWWSSFGVLLMLTFATRFYQLDQPAWVCWDETHFGKMGSW